jgi:hypothetical protein
MRTGFTVFKISMEVQKKGDARQQARTSVSFDSKIEHH